jgi:hypothetical protein
MLKNVGLHKEFTCERMDCNKHTEDKVNAYILE